MTVLYITYIEFSGCDSGNYIRPVRMYDAFLREGHSVYLLSGEQERNAWEERKKKVAETEKWLDSHTPDVCYIESSVYPLLLACDYRLIRRVHAMGVPIGYFYRDFYRKFPDEYPPRSDLLGRMKDAWLAHLWRKTDRLLHRADIVYFPTAEAARLFSYRDARALPPAGEDHLSDEKMPENNTCIFVGGLVKDYGGKQLLDAFCLLNRAGKYPLILVCREKEWKELAYPADGLDWLEVYHLTGDELAPLYRRARLGLSVNVPSRYNDVAISVKLFEYIGWGLPIVVNGSAAMERIVTENGIGCRTEYTPESLAEGVKKVLSDESYARRAEAFFRTGNNWTARAAQVVRELSEKKK